MIFENPFPLLHFLIRLCDLLLITGFDYDFVDAKTTFYVLQFLASLPLCLLTLAHKGGFISAFDWDLLALYALHALLTMRWAGYSWKACGLISLKLPGHCSFHWMHSGLSVTVLWSPCLFKIVFSINLLSVWLFPFVASPYTWCLPLFGCRLHFFNVPTCTSAHFSMRLLASVDSCILYTAMGTSFNLREPLFLCSINV